MPGSVFLSVQLPPGLGTATASLPASAPLNLTPLRAGAPTASGTTSLANLSRSSLVPAAHAGQWSRRARRDGTNRLGHAEPATTIQPWSTRASMAAMSRARRARANQET